MISFPECFLLLWLLITHCCLFTNTVFRHTFYTFLPFCFWKVFSLRTTLSSCNLPVNSTASVVGYQGNTKNFAWKESKWTAYLLEASCGFEWLSEICARNIVAPESPRRLHQTGSTIALLTHGLKLISKQAVREKWPCQNGSQGN